MDSKLIGEGSFGCIYEPPLPCQDGRDWVDVIRDYRDQRYIAKVTTPEEMDNLQILDSIKKIDPDESFHINYVGGCSLDGRVHLDACTNRVSYFNKKPIQQVIYPYGGVELWKYIHGDKVIQNSKNFIRNLDNLFRAIYKMSKNGFIHADIKPQNILVLEENSTYKFRLIDFGLSFKYNRNTRDFSGIYVYWPPEANMFQENIVNPEKIDRYMSNPFVQKYILPYAKQGNAKMQKIMDENDISDKIYIVLSAGLTSLAQMEDKKLYLLERYDVFSLGVNLHHLFRDARDLSEKNIGEIHNDILDLATSMMNLYIPERLTAKVAYIKYREILTKYNIV